SLETALSREPSRRLQPQAGDFQSQSNPPAFSRWSFSTAVGQEWLLIGLELCRKISSLLEVGERGPQNNDGRRTRAAIDDELPHCLEIPA
ncbi:MAG: hypothetical protein ACYCSN_04205, partial [Acidobacteriaceae bacterium]